MKKTTYTIQVITFNGNRRNYRNGNGRIWVFDSNYVAGLVASDLRSEHKFASVAVINH